MKASTIMMLAAVLAATVWGVAELSSPRVERPEPLNPMAEEPTSVLVEPSTPPRVEVPEAPAASQVAAATMRDGWKLDAEAAQAAWVEALRSGDQDSIEAAIAAMRSMHEGYAAIAK